MPLAAGQPAPDFRLSMLDGGQVELREWLRGGPVCLAFFKTTCPTCMLALPFLERMHQGTEGVRILAISQDPAAPTHRFHDDFELTLPTAFDPADTDYAVSNAYGITHVPSLFLVSAEGAIVWASAGFSKPDLEELAARFGFALFTANDRVPVWKPG